MNDHGKATGAEPALRAGVIGYGYWGPNLARNFMETPGCTVIGVCDQKESNLERAKSRYPSIFTTTDSGALLAQPGINLVAISTPVSTHHKLALAALRAGKNVLVEKPLASSSTECKDLIREAESRNLLLAVDHTFVFTPAVRKIKQLIEAGELGDVTYYDSTRINLGMFQHDVNVLWDLAVHDLAILDYLFDEKPTSVSATGISHLGNDIENIAFMTLFYPTPLIAHINVNWMSPVKVRHTLIGGSRKMIVYDDIEPTEKVKIYDKGIEIADTVEGVYQLKVSYRLGDMLAPNLDLTEALKAETLHLLDCLQNHKHPLVNGKTGMRIVKILETASRSIRNMDKTERLDHTP